MLINNQASGPGHAIIKECRCGIIGDDCVPNHFEQKFQRVENRQVVVNHCYDATIRHMP
jgi:hypothetical protein